MRFTAREYRSAKIRHHASIIEARPGFSRGAEKVEPDEYRQEHGKCPRGFHFDQEADKCVPTGGDKGNGGEDNGGDNDGDKEKTSSEERDAKLHELADSDWDAYRNEVDRMRESGELPDEETAEMMVKIKGFDDLPDDVKNDKEKIREILTQQQAQKEHEKRVIQEQMKYLKEFDEQNELAIERGDEPQKLNVVQMMTQINEDLGRELEKTPEEVAETVQGNEDMLLKALTGAAPKPGSKASKLKKWFERITQPLPDLSPLWDRIGGVRSSFRGDVMAKRRVKAVRRTQALLDSVAETLEERGALKLSRLVDAEASGLPEADKLPDGEKAKIWDEDWTQQTSDYREDLGFPPYDEARPKVKGDDAAD